MPSNMLDTDVGFPRFTGMETEEDKIAQILNYLFMLREQLQYTLSHLGVENFNDASLESLTQTITEPIRTRLEDDEGHISALQVTADELSSAMADAEGNISLLQQTVDGFTLKVINPDGTYSELDIGGGSIDLTGLVTFASLSGSGTTVINGDNIVTGTITGTTFLSGERLDIPTWLDTDPSKTVRINEGHITMGWDLDEPIGGVIVADIYLGKTGNVSYLGIAAYGSGTSGGEIRLYGDVYINDVLIS